MRQASRTTTRPAPITARRAVNGETARMRRSNNDRTNSSNPARSANTAYADSLSRPRIGPEKHRNLAVFRGWLCTLDWRRRLGITLYCPAFSAAVHLVNSVPTSLLLQESMT
jgi:hypothetical protein